MKIRPLFATLSGLALVLAACTGAEATGPTSPPEPAPIVTESPDGRTIEQISCGDSPPEDVAIVCEAYDLIKTRYVDEVADETLAEGAESGVAALDGAADDAPIRCAVPTEAFTTSCRIAADEADSTEEGAEAIVAGLADALDPNSVYLDPNALELLEEEQEGSIEGIGALVSPEVRHDDGTVEQCSVISETCRLYVVSTISGAPAAEAGLERDDMIVGVNGKEVGGRTVDEVTAQVRGPSGTDVVLQIRRGAEILDVTITREAVTIPVIATEIVGDTGYIRLTTFNQSAGDQFEEALTELVAADVDGVVLDLRNNPGGLLDTAIDVTSALTAVGDVVVTEGPEDSNSYSVSGTSILPEDVELVILVNKGSASASEVVSAVLQEQGRAVVLGERTFGKNTVQQRFSLSNGGALKLTIARWITPGGLDFGGVGVSPDVEVALDEFVDVHELVAAVLEAA